MKRLRPLPLIILSLICLASISSCSNSDDSQEDPVLDEDDIEDPVSGAPQCAQIFPPYPAFDFDAPFPNWSTSLYNLPYTKGKIFRVGQGNNTPGSHQNAWRFSYDFELPIGAEVRAARSGIVIHAVDGTPNGTFTTVNMISIRHIDGTVALYLHLSPGLSVQIGQEVNQGDVIALSGNTGNTNNVPHLHFGLHECFNFPLGPPGLPSYGNCNSLPVSFKNTTANPNGLGSGMCYEAL